MTKLSPSPPCAWGWKKKFARVLCNTYMYIMDWASILLFFSKYCSRAQSCVSLSLLCDALVCAEGEIHKTTLFSNRCCCYIYCTIKKPCCCWKILDDFRIISEKWRITAVKVEASYLRVGNADSMAEVADSEFDRIVLIRLWEASAMLLLFLPQILYKPFQSIHNMGGSKSSILADRPLHAVAEFNNTKFREHRAPSRIPSPPGTVTPSIEIIIFWHVRAQKFSEIHVNLTPLLSCLSWFLSMKLLYVNVTDKRYQQHRSPSLFGIPSSSTSLPKPFAFS